MPPLTVIGRLGACGNTKRIGGQSGGDQFRHDRHEIVAVGAEAVQPDHGETRIRSGFGLYAVEQHGHSSWGSARQAARFVRRCQARAHSGHGMGVDSGCADFRRMVPARVERLCCATCTPQEIPPMSRFAVAALLSALTALLAAPARAITLEQAMADPDWIGPPVEAPYWSVDGKSIYYRLKRKGSSVRDLHRVDLASGDGHRCRSGRDGRRRRPACGVRLARTPRRICAQWRCVPVARLASGRLTQITRTTEKEASPQFSADDRARAVPHRQRLVQSTTSPAA